MQDVATPMPLATPEDISTYLGVTTGTLHTWRKQGTGPAFIPVGGHVRYRWSEVEEWLVSQQKGTRDAA